MNKLKILLVSLPPFPLDQLPGSDSFRASYVVPPMGLMYLADSILEQEYTEWVKCLDFSLFGYDGVKSCQEYETFIESKLSNYRPQPDIVCIALTFSASYGFFELVAAAVKKLWPTSVLITGGIHATNTLDFILQNNPHTDYVVCGEGEEALPELLQALALGHGQEQEKIKNIRGVHFEGNIKRAAPHELNESKFERARPPASINIDFARYTQVFAMDAYTQNADLFAATVKDATGKYFPLMASRGCPVECIFCSAHTVHGRRPRWRDTANIMAEIDWLRKNYGVNKIHLMDDNFVPKSKAIELFRALAEIKADGFEAVVLNMNVNFTDKEIIDAIAGAGIKNITFAIESGSPEMQKKIKKHCNLQKAKALIAYCREKAIETRCFYLLGFPGETPAQMRQTIDFAAEAGADWSSFHLAVPLPGSKMYGEFVRMGCIQDGPGFWQTINYHERTFDTPEITASDLRELMRTADLRLNFLNSPYLAKHDKDSLLIAGNIFRQITAAFDFHIFAHDCLRRVYKLMGEDAKSQKTLHYMKHLLSTDDKAKEFSPYIHLLDEEAREFLTS